MCDDKGADRRSDALYIASRSGCSDMALIKVLLDRGWDRTYRDVEGRTTIEIAKADGHRELVEHLESYQTAMISPPLSTSSSSDPGPQPSISPQ